MSYVGSFMKPMKVMYVLDFSLKLLDSLGDLFDFDFHITQSRFSLEGLFDIW
jgi:hypothetical protein